jgi:hypothetical protein
MTTGADVLFVICSNLARSLDDRNDRSNPKTDSSKSRKWHVQHAVCMRCVRALIAVQNQKLKKSSSKSMTFAFPPYLLHIFRKLEGECRCIPDLFNYPIHQIPTETRESLPQDILYGSPSLCTRAVLARACTEAADKYSVDIDDHLRIMCTLIRFFFEKLDRKPLMPIAQEIIFIHGTRMCACAHVRVRADVQALRASCCAR